MDENDISRLIRLAIPEEAIPDAEMRKRAYAKLEGELRGKETIPAFPPLVLAGLAVLMAGAAAWAVAQILMGGDGILVGGVVFTLGLNAIFLPIAAAVIVVDSRRRNRV